MAVKTRLIVWMFMITEISIHGNSIDVQIRNEKCDSSMTLVHCEGLSGKFIPSDCSVHVSVMYIMESNMSSLSEDDFAALENLSTIYIDSCTITFSSNIFSPVKSLRKLEIINSNASEEVFNLLGSARQLLKLSLEGNKITCIKKGIFNSLSRLEETDVHPRNMLEIMNFTASEPQFSPFRNASNPATSSFENNKVIRVKKQVFHSWSHLKEIDLSHNEISTIEANAFEGLSALRKLDISNNRLIGVFDHNANKGVFDNLSHLEEIDLSHNEITTIEAGAFEGLSALRRLDLSQNRLSDDFDPTSLSLPVGCVFQLLVATCPKPAMNDEPSHDQHPAHNAAKNDFQQQQQAEQQEADCPEQQIQQQEEKERKMESQPAMNNETSHEDQSSGLNVTTDVPHPQMPPWGFGSDGASIQGGLDFTGLLGAALLVVFPGLR